MSYMVALSAARHLRMPAAAMQDATEQHFQGSHCHSLRGGEQVGCLEASEERFFEMKALRRRFVTLFTASEVHWNMSAWP